MAIFNYTLPSGAQYQLNAPTGTTQAQADNIFYSQVAAGTFVGYNKGDRLTHPKETINNFGISRLQRGTAGVDDKTVLAIISGLPLVASLPTLDQTPVSNPINQTNYIQVTNSPTGPVGLSPVGVGPLSSTQTQALMAQIAATVQASSNTQITSQTLTQNTGVGIYGFNCQQLEQAGLIKPGYCQRFCPLNASTGANPDNFVEFMNSPSPWTGLHGVTTVNDIVGQQALQNTIQETLFNQSYNQLVSNGTIVPPASDTSIVATPTTTPTTGQVYDTTGTLVTTSTLALLSAGLNGGLNVGSSSTLYSDTVSTLGSVGNSISNLFSNFNNTSVGDIPVDIQSLGSDAIASYSSGLSSLSTGAVGFATNTLNSIASATGSAASQLSGLATGLTGGNIAGTVASISSTISGDIGALITTGSKYGTELATAWADGASSTLSSIGSNLGSLASNVSNTAQNAFNTAQTSLTEGINSLAKSAQSSINFSDFSLSNMVAGVQPAAGFTNTVNRATVDAAVTRVIGSPLITPPTYELPSVSSLGISADIAQAKNLLAQAQTASSGLLAQAQDIASQAQGAASRAVGQATSATKNLFG